MCLFGSQDPFEDICTRNCGSVEKIWRYSAFIPQFWAKISFINGRYLKKIRKIEKNCKKWPNMGPNFQYIPFYLELWDSVLLYRIFYDYRPPKESFA